MIDRFRRALVLVSVFALASFVVPSAVAAESHDSHGGAHESGKGKGKGGKSSGHKDAGSSHSKETHEGGSHTGGSGAGGSKALENKVLRGDRGRGKGPAYKGGRDADADTTHHESDEAHAH